MALIKTPTRFDVAPAAAPPAIRAYHDLIKKAEEKCNAVMAVETTPLEADARSGPLFFHFDIGSRYRTFRPRLYRRCRLYVMRSCGPLLAALALFRLRIHIEVPKRVGVDVLVRQQLRPMVSLMQKSLVSTINASTVPAEKIRVHFPFFVFYNPQQRSFFGLPKCDGLWCARPRLLGSCV
jgi:hypothetical protein